MPLVQTVHLIEVSPRDGLQNEPHTIPTSVKIKLINLLRFSGLKTIEVTSFVSPKWVPQMSDHRELMHSLCQQEGVDYLVLVPNQQGYLAAKESGARAIAVFISASETFAQKNTHCSLQQGLERALDLIQKALSDSIKVRGYLSCALGCPYEGAIDSQITVDMAKKLYDAGCDQIALGDTIGVGTPNIVQTLLKKILKLVPSQSIAMHFHNTYGQALANIYASMELGITHFDASVAGLGGCPYAPGASGNVATEDVLYMLDRMGIETGVNLDELIKASEFITRSIKKPPRSYVAQALMHSRIPWHHVVGC